MALPSGCHRVCRPRRSKPRLFTPAKLKGIVEIVCREYGADEVKKAVSDGLSGCPGGEIELPCKLIDALIHSVEAWNDVVGPFFDWLVWIIDKWTQVVDFADRFGVKLKKIPTPDKVLGVLRDLRDGSVRAELVKIRRANDCGGYETGGNI